MNRTHWILLIAGALIIALGSVVRRADSPPAGPLPPELANEPELYMRGAVITQFNADGTLRYRLRARQLFHFPDQQRSLLEVPRLHFLRDDAVPWDASSDRGRVVYVDGADGSAGEREIVHLEQNVVLLRERPEQGRFMRLETSRLTVHPDTDAAETDEPVTIFTEVGTTQATGMTARLAAGQLTLGTIAGQRVTTLITRPELLETPRAARDADALESANET